MTTIRKIIPLAFAALAIFGGAAPAHAIPPKFQGEWAIPAGKFLEGRFPLARQVKQFTPEAVAGWGGTFEVGNRDMRGLTTQAAGSIARSRQTMKSELRRRATTPGSRTYTADVVDRARQQKPAPTTPDGGKTT